MLGQKPPMDPLTVWRRGRRQMRRPSPKRPTPMSAARRAAAREAGTQSTGDSGKRRWLPCPPGSAPSRSIRSGRTVFDAIDDIWSATPESGSRLKAASQRCSIPLAGRRTCAEPGVAHRLAGTEARRPERAGQDRPADQGARRARQLRRDASSRRPGLRRRYAPSTMRASSRRAVGILVCSPQRAPAKRSARNRSEIDLTTGLWTMPPERLKTGRKVKKPHVVPLSIAPARSSRKCARSPLSPMSFPAFATAGRWTAARSLSF